MRRILATSLMLPSLLFPAVAKASTPVDDASASTPQVRVSTGVIAPTLLDSANLSIPENFIESFFPAHAQVGLTLTVDEEGQPQDIRVVKSFNPLMDSLVVDAVRSFHYKPGTLDNQPVPVEVDLTVDITR